MCEEEKGKKSKLDQIREALAKNEQRMPTLEEAREFIKRVNKGEEEYLKMKKAHTPTHADKILRSYDL